MSRIANDAPNNVIPTNSLNLTRFSGVAAAIVAVVTAVGKIPWAKFLGGSASAAVRASIIVAAIAAWAAIAVADILARGVASAAKVKVQGGIVSLPHAVAGKLLDDEDELGWKAVALRLDQPGDLLFFVVKPGQKARWVPMSGFKST